MSAPGVPGAYMKGMAASAASSGVIAPLLRSSAIASWSRTTSAPPGCEHPSRSRSTACGWVRASSCAIVPPMETPKMVARANPAACRTARIQGHPLDGVRPFGPGPGASDAAVVQPDGREVRSEPGQHAPPHVARVSQPHNQQQRRPFALDLVEQVGTIVLNNRHEVSRLSQSSQNLAGRSLGVALDAAGVEGVEHQLHSFRDVFQVRPRSPLCQDRPRQRPHGEHHRRSGGRSQLTGDHRTPASDRHHRSAGRGLTAQLTPRLPLTSRTRLRPPTACSSASCTACPARRNRLPPAPGGRRPSS